MKAMVTTLAIIGIFWSVSGFSQNTTRKEIPIGHAPIELVRPAIKDLLSPQGKFVLLANKGTMVVIDVPENIKLVEEAIAKLEVPNPNVALNFAFKTGVAGGMSKGRPVEFYDFPFPTRFLPARIIPNGNNGFIVIPPHPTDFRTRKIGTIVETRSFVNPDGSVNVDIDFQNTEFEGFINYGSGVFPSGTSGVIPVAGQIANPRFFNPYVNSTKILVPIFSSTRITTQIVVRPTVNGGVVKIEMFPQLKIDSSETGEEPKVITLKKFRTTIDLQNNRLGKLNGFEGASGEFNRNFMGGNDDQEGTSALLIKAQVFHGEVKEVKTDEPEKTSQSEVINAEQAKAKEAEAKGE